MKRRRDLELGRGKILSIREVDELLPRGPIFLFDLHLHDLFAETSQRVQGAGNSVWNTT